MSEEKLKDQEGAEKWLKMIDEYLNFKKRRIKELMAIGGIIKQATDFLGLTQDAPQQIACPQKRLALIKVL